IILVVCGLVFSLLLLPSVKAVQIAGRARAAAAGGDIVVARVPGAAARTWGWYTFGYAAAIGIIFMFARFLVGNHVARGHTFFNLPLMLDSFWLVLRAFWVNVYMCIIAEVLVLIWGLIVAIARLLPGAPAQPIRFIATAYADIFRGLPAIITIYLVA